MSKLLSDTIDMYLRYRKTAYTVSTARSSEQTLRQFLSVVGNVQSKGLSPRHAERFQSRLLQEGKKPNTVNQRMSQLAAFSKWAVANRYAPAHFVATVRTIPVPRASRLRIPATDFARVLDCADRPDQRATVALGLFMFLRSGEIRSLKVGDVDLEQGLISVTIHKTNDWDEMPIFHELDQELRRWFIAYQQDIGRPLRSGDYLIPAHKQYSTWRGRPASGNFRPEKWTFRPFEHVQAVLDKAGYAVRTDDGHKNGEGVHTLRRSGARALYDALVDGRLGGSLARDDALRQVMTALHHKSIATTQLYIGIEADRVKRDRTMKGMRFLPEVASNVTELRKVENE